MPLSVMSNWEKQIEEHCVPGVLSSIVYYGTSRGVTAEQLARRDVVITTYHTVVAEADRALTSLGPNGERRKKRKKSETGLFDVKWKVSW